MTNNKKTLIGIGLGVYICLLLGTYFWAQYSLLHSIETAFTRDIATEPSNKSFLGMGDFKSKQFFVKQLRAQLKTIETQAIMPILTHCQCDDIGVSSPYSDANRTFLSPQLHLKDPWFYGVYTTTLSCEIHWLNWLLGQLAVTALVLITLIVVPKPITVEQKHYLDKYRQYKITVATANTLIALSDKQRHLLDLVLTHERADKLNMITVLDWVQQTVPPTLTTDHLAWFEKALELGEDKEKAFQIACETPHELTFLPLQRSVRIRGITIKLPPTPFFYYLWYATGRALNDGWILNPQTNKPDTKQAEELIVLMQEYNGHGKAINDLERHGLTAKKLDQNRNKIKDEITLILGATLAENYLFESKRDFKTQRYAYRIRLSPDKIAINKDDSTN